MDAMASCSDFLTFFFSFLCSIRNRVLFQNYAIYLQYQAAMHLKLLINKAYVMHLKVGLRLKFQNQALVFGGSGFSSPYYRFVSAFQSNIFDWNVTLICCCCLCSQCFFQSSLFAMLILLHSDLLTFIFKNSIVDGLANCGLLCDSYAW